MSHTPHRSIGASLLLLVSLLLLAVTLVAGCGEDGGTKGGSQDDEYLGTWIQTTSLPDSPNVSITITKDGDDYVLSGPDGSTAQGYLLHTEPTSTGEVTIYAMTLEDTQATEEGDHLTFGSADNTIEISVSGDSLTLVVSSVDGDFLFERTAT